MPTSRSIREMLQDDNAFESRDEWSYAVKVVEQLESAYISETPLAERAVLICDILATLSHLSDPDTRLLANAACARWFARHSYLSLGAVAASTYHDTCLAMTDGNKKDLFNVLSDIVEAEAAMNPEIGTGLVEKDFLWLARALKMSSFAFGTTQSVVKSKVAQAFAPASKKQKIIDREIEEHASRIRSYLRIAKGSLLKTAQAAVFIDATMPEPIAREIRNLTTSIEPLDHTLSRKIIERELGAPIESIFTEWNPYPVGAASIGQVHRGRLKSGQEVAIKVQYPNMREVLKQQSAAAKLLSPMFKFFYPSVDIDLAVEETTRLLIEETDYTKELFHLNLAHAASLSIPGIRVPKPIKDLSTDKVLTMEFLEGTRFWEFQRGVNQEEKNRAAATIVRAHFEMRYKYKIFNYDPHPGNFLFGPDYVGFIDFGSASSGEDEILDGFKTIYNLVKNNEKHRTVEVLNDLGFVGDPKTFNAEAAWALLCNDFKPFTENKLTKISMDQIQSSMKFVSKNQNSWNVPPKWLGHFRSNLGLYTVLSALDAEVNLNQIVEPLVE